MKNFTGVLMAVLCATAVSAAPPTTPNFSIKEYGLSNVFERFADMFDGQVDGIRCMCGVIDGAVENTVYKGRWEETKYKVDFLITVEWQRCSEISNHTEQAECKRAVITTCLEFIVGFFGHLVSNGEVDLVTQITANIGAQCSKVQFEELEVSIPEQSECIANVLGDVSTANGLGELWSKYEPQLRDHIDKWKKCPNAGNKPLEILCNIKEGGATYLLVTEYVPLAAAQKPNIVEEFARQIQQRCLAKTYTESKTQLEGESDRSDPVEKVKCITEAINDAVKETDFNKIWQEYKKQLEQLFERVKACKNESSHSEAAKCIAKELQKGQEILQKFYSALKQANSETYERVKKYIKERCFA